ncbi:MAG: hypothetical protein IJ404_03340 [Clostridia bacterium]|nr:hypothetical protein [Clostridia bacterium]
MSDAKINAVTKSAEEIISSRAILSEKMLSHLSELAEVLCDEADDDEIFFRDEAFINRFRLLTDTPIGTSVAPFNENEIRSEERLLSTAEKAFLCLRLSEILGIKSIDGAETFFDGTQKAENETVSCVKNHSTDTAYLSFASKMTDPRVSYADDFTEVVKSVYYGKTAYCILPIANSHDGRLAGISNLALKYGLKTALCHRVKSDDDSYTVYALLRKDIQIPKGASETYFEFALKNEDGPSEILNAAECCGMKTVSVSFTPESNGESRIILKVSDSGFCGFLTYLSLNYPDYTPIGIFEEI